MVNDSPDPEPPPKHDEVPSGEAQSLLPQSVPTTPTIYADAFQTATLAVPIFLSKASFTGMKVTDAALLGHSSADALAAASLSDLVR